MVGGFEYIKDVWVLEDVCEIGKSYVVIPYEPAGGKTLIAHFGEIIRCRDCKNWDTTWHDWAKNYHYCPLIDGVRNGDWFCADAERRETEW